MPAKTTDDPLISAPELAEQMNVSTQTIRRWWKAGQMPAPRRFGRRVIRWRRSDIDEWIEQQAVRETETC